MTSQRCPACSRSVSVGDSTGQCGNDCALGHPKNGFTIIELLVVMLIMGLLVALLIPAVNQAREAARRISCGNNLRQIGLALHGYASAFDRFPPGNVMYGPCCNTKSYTTWTIESLPFLESNSLYAEYDQQKFNEDEENRRVRETRVAVYACPSEPNVDQLGFRDSGPGSQLKWMPGSYRAMTGRASRSNWWGNYFEERPRLDVTSRGVMHTVGNPGPTGLRTRLLKRVRIKEIRDGLSRTIAVGERSIEPRHSEGHLRRTAWAYSYGSYNKSAAYTQLRIFLRNYDECIRIGGLSGELPCKHGWSSFHPGGLHFLFCDGSVHFLSLEEFDLNVFASQATIDGRETDGERID